MKQTDCEILIIGAGAAGLAATVALTRAGKNVCCLEATDRVGGRILTVRDPLSPVPIELGAEFIHGRPPEILDLVSQAGLTVYEHSPHALHLDRGRILEDREVGELADRVLSELAKSAKPKDESFEDFLHRSHQRLDVKNWARVHIEGFNAARQELISATQLKQDSEAAEQIEGDRAFRILNGYDSLPHFLLRSIPNPSTTVQLNSIVERIEWTRGHAAVHFRSALNNEPQILRCKRLIITVSLGVLKSGAIQFEPAPGEVLEAARTLGFGQVFRVTFRFDKPFWEEDERFKSAGFLISQDKPFFTWWTTQPVSSPILTGWSAGSAAEGLRGARRSAVFSEALACLGRILNRKIPGPRAAWFEDWHANQFFLGAYSHVPVDGMAARDVLTEPLDGTLFFAGEATNNMGHGGTVHGAIASGIRAARQVVKK